jgi:hypothetical protein
MLIYLKNILKGTLNDKYIKKYRIFRDKFRAKTTYFRPLPDFIIVGAQKSGTSSLYYYLTQHPKIITASKKEIHFFDKNFMKGIKWYRKHFPLSVRFSKETITGEASPYYLFHPRVAQRISQTLPNVKIIVLLRNPTERAISHYWHEVREGREKYSMVKAFKKESQRLKGEKERIVTDKDYNSFNYPKFSYLKRGIYTPQLKEYFKYFDKCNVKIIKSEIFFKNPQKTCNEIAAFLGLNPFQLQNKKVYNMGTRDESTEKYIIEMLNNYYEKPNKDLSKLLGGEIKW